MPFAVVVASSIVLVLPFDHPDEIVPAVPRDLLDVPDLRLEVARIRPSVAFENISFAFLTILGASIGVPVVIDFVAFVFATVLVPWIVVTDLVRPNAVVPIANSFGDFVPTDSVVADAGTKSETKTTMVGIFVAKDPHAFVVVVVVVVGDVENCHRFDLKLLLLLLMVESVAVKMVVVVGFVAAKHTTILVK